MKTTINGITYEGTPEEILTITAALAASAASASAPAPAPVHTYTPRPETRARLERYLAISDASLATIIRQSFDATPEDKRKFSFLFLKGLVRGVSTRMLNLSLIPDADIAARVRQCITRQLETGTTSTAVTFLDHYAKRTLASSVK